MTTLNDCPPVYRAEIDRLKAELAKAQSEKAELAAAIATEPELPGQIPLAIADFFELNPEECCRAIVCATKKSIASRANSGKALRDLLGPTVELLRQATLRPITWQDDVKAELARLRAAMEGKSTEQITIPNETK